VPPFRILLVDDNEDWFHILRRCLEAPEYLISYFATAEAAITGAASLNPQLAILDVHMPDLSGHELCARLRLIPGLERLPVLSWSAYPMEKVKSLNIGADGFVSKTSSKTVLKATVAAILRRVALDTGLILRGDLSLDPRANSVSLDGRPVASLTLKEFLFFSAIVEKSPEPVSRDELHDRLHQVGDALESRALETLVTRIRRRLGRPLADRIRGSRRFGWIYLPDAGPRPSRRGPPPR